jgi:N-formylglutamate deformylase
MRLPILLSVPHAGLEVPAELAPRCRLSPEEIVADGDEGARQIYALEDRVEAFVTTPIARAVLDQNRAPGDLRKDGIVKTHTCWDVPIWRRPLEPSEIEALVAAHHAPYHAALTAAASGAVRLGLDGHTMAAFGPPVGPDPGVERPTACLGNGDGTCPQAWLEGLGEALERSFGRAVALNEPFRGGYIVRRHAAELPWIQLELSRAPWASLEDKRAMVLEALARFVESAAFRRGPG